VYESFAEDFGRVISIGSSLADHELGHTKIANSPADPPQTHLMPPSGVHIDGAPFLGASEGAWGTNQPAAANRQGATGQPAILSPSACKPSQ